MARVVVFGSYVVPLCWNSVGQLWALLAAPEGYVGPFGGYVLTMLRNLGLSWRLLKAMLDIWRLCWDYLGQLEALLLVFAGYAGAFGGHVGTTLGTSGLFWWLLKAMLGGLCCDYLGQLGALLAVFEGYVRPFGGYARAMFDSLWLC